MSNTESHAIVADRGVVEQARDVAFFQADVSPSPPACAPGMRQM